MTDFTRLTIIGTTRKADLVIPNDEAIGGLMPRLMDLLGEGAGSVARPLTLVRTTGEQLDVGLSAADQEVVDGELLRFVRSDDAPPPPEVADVTDVLGESLGDRIGLWSARSRQLTGALGLGVISLAAVSVLPPAPTAYAVGLVLVLLAALGLGRLGARWGTVALTAVALGSSLPIAAHLAADAVPTGPLRWGTAAALAALIGWVVLGVGFGLGLALRPALWGSLLGAGLVALPLVLVALGVTVTGAVSVTAAVAVVACGLLPRYAMTAAGLTGLDDQVVEGHLRRRDDVEVTVHEAYRSLTWSSFAVAVPLAATGAWLLAAGNLWAVGVGALLVVVTALRTRSFPLADQQLALWLAVLGAVVGGLLLQTRLDDTMVALLLVGMAVLAVILVVVRPAPHQRAFWRRTGNLVEALAVIALIPLLLGQFGVYHDLLGAFKK